MGMHPTGVAYLAPANEGSRLAWEPEKNKPRIDLNFGFYQNLIFPTFQNSIHHFFIKIPIFRSPPTCVKAFEPGIGGGKL